MHNAPDGARRHLKNVPSAGLGIRTEVATSNVTTNHFVGAKQRSWMLPQAGHTFARIPAPGPPGRTTEPGKDHTADVPTSNVNRSIQAERPISGPDTSPKTVVNIVDSNGSGSDTTRQESGLETIIPCGGDAASANALPTRADQNNSSSHTVAEVIDLTALASQEESSTATQIVASLPQIEGADRLAQIMELPTKSPTAPVVQNQHLQQMSQVVTPAGASHDLPRHEPQRAVSAGSSNSNTQTRPAVGLLTPAPSPQTLISQAIPRKRPLEVVTNDLSTPATRLRSNSPREPHRRNQSVTFPDRSQDHSLNHLNKEAYFYHNLPPRRTTSVANLAQVRPTQGLHYQQMPVQDIMSSQSMNWPTNTHLRRTSDSTTSHSPTFPGTPSTKSKGQSYLLTLESQIADICRRMDLSSSARDLRIPWLREACNNNDLFFLLLNQLYCTFTLQPDVLQQFGLDHVSNAGFSILQLLFGSNRDFPEELTAFLAGWPNSPYSLRATPELRDWTLKTGHFLARLGKGWDGFRQSCLLRRRPPTALEIDAAFQMPQSVVLPRAIYSSLLHQMLPSAPQAFSGAAFNTFVVNQKQHYARCNGHAPAISAQQDADLFNEIYRNLLGQYWPMHPSAAVALSPTTRPPHRISTDMPNYLVPHTVAHGVQTPQARQNMPPPTAAGRICEITRMPHRHQASPSTTTTASTATNFPDQYHAASSVPQPPNQELGPIQSNYMRAQLQQAPVHNVTQSGRAPPYARSAMHTNVRVDLVPSNASRPAQHAALPQLSRLPALLTNPLPEQEALHQLHLHQPVTEVDGYRTGQPPCLYQYIESSASVCHHFTIQNGFFSVDFDIPEHHLDRKVSTIESDNPCVLPKRNLTRDSILFNLRCVQLPPDQAIVDHNWAALSTCWPQHIFISINDNFLELRRKRQHRRDLPIDITPFVKSGPNTFKASIHTDPIDKDNHFGIAVEVIGFRSASQIKNMPTRVTAENSRQALMNEMHPHVSASDDDDIEMITDRTTMSISDPFSSLMVLDPVRGKTCKHKNCFDLDTFLQSRPSDDKDAISSVYEWRCPIGSCKEDVRPCSLVRDGFLQEVIAQLVEEGKTNTRSIIVRNDGTWEPKIEDGNDATGSKKGGSDHATSSIREKKPQELSTAAQAELAFSTTGASKVMQATTEVIELDDD